VTVLSSPGLLGSNTLLGLLNGLLWMAVVPPWQTPDDPKHIEYVRLLSEGTQIPAFASDNTAPDPGLQRRILASMDDTAFWWYGRAPAYAPESAPPSSFAQVWLHGSHTAYYRASPLYYVTLSLLQPSDLLRGLYVARLVSVLLGTLVVLLTGLTARELFLDDPFVRHGAPAMVALLPMFAFVHSGVNSDALVNALAALAFFLMARLLVRGAAPSRLVLMVGAVTAAIAVKRIGLVLVPPLLLTFLLWGAGIARRSSRAVLATLVTAVALISALVTWLAAGGWSAMPSSLRWSLTQYFFNEPDQVSRLAAYLRAPGALRVIADYAWRIHNTFWGSFGWQVVEYPRWAYVAAAVLVIAAAAGSILIVTNRHEPAARRMALLVFGVATIHTVVAAIGFFVDYLDMPYPVPPQGRYLFLVMLPIAVLFVAGLGKWLPKHRRASALLALVVLLLAVDLGALLGLVVPFFYG